MKSGGNKKNDGAGQIKVSKPVEPEDVEVKHPSMSGFCMLIISYLLFYMTHDRLIFFSLWFAASRNES